MQSVSLWRPCERTDCVSSMMSGRRRSCSAHMSCSWVVLQADKQGTLLHAEERALVSLLPVTYSVPVDREHWVGAVFTHDGKHVLGASASSKHRIHIWSNSGEPVATLEGWFCVIKREAIR